MKNVFAKLVAFILTAAMLVGITACSATESNPVIGKIGDVKITFSQYQSIFQQYYSYYMMGSLGDFDLNEHIKEQLIAYGVTLNRCHVEGIELNEEEEAELDKQVKEQLDSSLESITVDEGITDEQEIYDAKLEKFKASLRQSGVSYKNYMADLEQRLREDMLMEKLRNNVYAEITIADSDVKAYYDDNIEDARENYDNDHITDFYQAYSSYIQGNAMIPLYIPNNVFTVKHMLVQFDKTVNDVKDGTFDDEAQKLIDETLELIKKDTTTKEDFDNFVKEKSEDNGMQDENIFKHGYVMHEDLVNTNNYVDGFAYAAMKLYAGHDWEPKASTAPQTTASPAPDSSDDASSTPEATTTPEPTPTVEPTAAPSPTATPEPKTYDIEYFTLSDGTEIAAVKTTYGIHYIYINNELKAGDVEFVDDPENEIWQNIHDFVLKERQEAHYQDRFNDWKAETKIRMKDKYIDQIAARLYGLK